jgi:hypothetical protein
VTCIVGLVDGDKVYIGGDSLGTDENGGTLINIDKKVFCIGDFLIGRCGSLRMGQIVRYSFLPPEYNSNEHDSRDAIYAYMATLFVQEIKACFDKLEYKEEEKGYILVGFQNRLFRISMNNLQVEEESRGYSAIGIGSDIAKGSLYATREVGFTPDFKVKLALEASAEHNAFVRGPFVIESI